MRRPPTTGQRTRLDKDERRVFPIFFFFLISFYKYTLFSLISDTSLKSQIISYHSLNHSSKMISNEDSNQTMERIMFNIGNQILANIFAMQEQEAEEQAARPIRH